MNQELMEKLIPITEEEQNILLGNMDVDKNIYTAGKDFTIDSKKMLKKGKVIDIRSHTRFIHFPKHRHNFIEIMYMCSGQTCHIINSSVKVVLEKGDLIFLNQHTFHEILPASQNDIGVNFMVLPEFFDVAFQLIENDSVIGKFLVSTLCQDENQGQYLHFKVADILPVQNLIENMVWSLVNRPEHKYQINQYTMGLLFMHLLTRTDLIDTGTVEQYENKLIFTCLKYIEDYYKNANLTELSMQLNQSVFKLSKLIRSYTGETFKELLQQKRLDKAGELLSKTSLSISDIINAVGYDNTSYFYRIFRNKFGISPKEYRHHCK